MEIKRVAIIGAGVMGAGLTQVFAQAGYEVVLMDTVPAQLDRAMATIDKYLRRGVQKGRLSPNEKEQALERITTSSSLESIGGVDFVLEAITEDLGTKQMLFRRLEEICPPNVIFASNTSSISITQMASSTKRPKRFIGMHFSNPVPVMRLVEVVRGLRTSDETCAIITELGKSLGKVPIEVNDYPGFAGNRVVLPMINEAVYALMEGVGTKEAIDGVVKLGMNYPMGPLEVADLIGLDVCLHILEVLHRELGDPKFRPCPLLRKMVAAGYLGRKTGRGFYTYDDGVE